MIKTKKTKYLELINVLFDDLDVTLSNYGASIIDIKTKNQNGKKESIVLKHRRYKDYLNDFSMMGKTVGRVAGRIENGCFKIDDKNYSIPLIQGNHLLHSGKHSLANQSFAYSYLEDKDYAKIDFFYLDREEVDSFPGDLSLKVSYEITNDSILITYFAKSNKDTLCNITNHSYFNLSGDFKYPMNDTKLRIDSNYFYTNDETGLILDKKEVYGGFDFRGGKIINDNIINTPNKGLDHFFLLDDGGKIVLEDIVSKRRVIFEGSQTGVQIFSPMNDKNDVWFIAVELQNLPNGINREEKDKSILRKNQEYKHYIRMVFK